EGHVPREPLRPPGPTSYEVKAARTPFADREGLRFIDLPLPSAAISPRAVKFVLHQTASGQWLKSAGREMLLPLLEPGPDGRLPSPRLQYLAEQIVSAEVGSSSWTLMHRFHRCRELLEQAQDNADALALLFVWLRYSAIRQLDWQRNYNTKPRELSHAQDQLTTRLAAVWQRQPAGSPGRFWVRLMLTTLGRGGEGQQVRDEILH